MMPLTEARRLLAALGLLAVTLLAGFTGGYVTKGRFVEAEQIRHANTEIQKTANGIAESVQVSNRIEKEITVAAVRSEEIKKAVVQRIEVKKEKRVEEIAQGIAPVCPEFRLDVGTVFLLNAARKGSVVESTGSSDAALDTPSNIGIKEFALNDIDVVKMYHDLAKRHDELVDAVEEKLKSQGSK
jgi:hypothetical protein